MEAALETEVGRILDALRRIRVPAVPGEYDIHALIAAALEDANIPFAHEVPLAPGRRADFLAGSVVIEVKKGRPQRARLAEQAAKYLSSPRVEALVVVSQRRAEIPGFIGGKPVYSLALERLWGVSLP